MSDEGNARRAPRDEQPGDGADGALEFEGTAPFAARSRASRRRRALLATLAVTLALALLLATQPGLRASLAGLAPSRPQGTLLVFCNVPWAVAHVDGRGPSAGVRPSRVSSLPTATFRLAAGAHTLRVEASGFAPLQARVTVQANVTTPYVADVQLSASGAALALDAINTFLGGGLLALNASVPTALWEALGLLARPPGATLRVSSEFVATGLDPQQPIYIGANSQRPVEPEPGWLGVATEMSEHTRIQEMAGGSCDGPTLAERVTPLRTPDAVAALFSVQPAHASGASGATSRGAGPWVAARPYLLRPALTLYTDPSQAVQPADRLFALALAAHATLATALGAAGNLAAAVSVDELSLGVIAGEAAPAPGAYPRLASDAFVLDLGEQTQVARYALFSQSPDAPARWLYVAGAVQPISPQAAALTPHQRMLSPEAVAAVVSLANGTQPAAPDPSAC